MSVAALSQLYLNNRFTSGSPMDLPNEIAGMRLKDSKSGDQAISEFTDLHGKSFPVTSGAVGTYGNREITLWVASTPSDSIARELTVAMQKRIAEGKSPFTPINEINQRNRKVYVLEGMGQKHYYFQSKNLVIWLAANPSIADEAFQQILEVYS